MRSEGARARGRPRESGRARATETRPRRIRHLPSRSELCFLGCVPMIRPIIDIERKVRAASRARVLV